ncbi:energy transducer TonB [Pseudomonas sp. LS44]|uniref:energy transducer TonB family protein n=1 Tax=Pseudomonas sp. LS44 TaxID=1357074 RepID=UPI00215A532A|nr:energy transducer TonB [Pseudomonas sp. LS44]UVE17719.1 energy transducer TonB [Pseudomonas sp. LS44]
MSERLHKLSRYGVSLIVVLALHFGLALWALYWHPQAAPVELPPAAMLIELEPLPPAAPKPAPPPPPEVVEPEPQPKLIEAPKPKLALTPPKPKPKPKPPTPKPPKPVEPKPQPEQPPQDTPPAPAAETDSKPAAQQLAAVSAPSQAKVTWQSKLLAHLARYKRYPDDARRRGFEGTTRVRFSVDGNGNVLAVELAGTSGSASLDRATLAMIRRAQPLPKPPAELLDGNSLEVVAPFVYSLDRRR